MNKIADAYELGQAVGTMQKKANPLAQLLLPFLRQSPTWAIPHLAGGAAGAGLGALTAGEDNRILGALIGAGLGTGGGAAARHLMRRPPSWMMPQSTLPARSAIGTVSPRSGGVNIPV
jgi:hypothetical protein